MYDCQNTTVIAILPESITAKEIHPIDAVIQIHSGIVTVVVTGIRRQSAIQSRLALLFNTMLIIPLTPSGLYSAEGLVITSIRSILFAAS